MDKTAKIVFFDIDNTLLDENNHIPESTFAAVEALRGNGHLAVLCSGRTRGFIRDPRLLSMQFDGMVAGCGTEIEFRGETLLEHLFDSESALFAVETAKRFRFPVILEGPRYLYLDEEDFPGDRYVERVRSAMGEDLLRIGDTWGNWEMNKFSCAVNHETEEECLGLYEQRFDLLRHNADVIEFVPPGFDKCTGMAHLCEHLGIAQEDTYAMGDSANDIGMLRWAGTGIAMGNGQDAAKAAADYVTDALREEGVKKALAHFGLI